MKITEHVVKAVSDHVKEVTTAMVGESWRMGLGYIGGSTGHGTRYVDGRQQLVWLGAREAPQAAAYYYGVAVAAETARGGNADSLPDWLQSIGAEVWQEQKWINRGAADFRSNAERAAHYAGR
ncbi:hypothetical protein [Micromonospora chalcea]|uniref:hypothetical protein n=1 Tax=Micromonospora chalcea TaxID=1874 RepID=UPI003D7026C1